MSESESRVLTLLEDGVAHVRLNRPNKRNGLDLPMFEVLIETGIALGQQNDVRAVVLSGEGAAFCAGLDFQAFLTDPSVAPKLLERKPDSIANVAQRVAWVWQELRVPVIAALHGPCFGGGLQIALAADIRYASPDTRMSVMEIEWGLIPDMSITQTLLRLVRPDIAKELTFSGRIVDADEARDLGLVTRVTPNALADALATARQIAARSPQAIVATKRLFNEAPKLSLAEAFLLETKLQLTLLGSANQSEAVGARLAKRTAKFHDLD